MIKSIGTFVTVLTLLSLISCSDGSSSSQGLAEVPTDIDTDNDGVSDTNDCAINDSSVWTYVSYVTTDLDHDGVESGIQGRLCSNGILPEGYFSTSLNSSILDCNDNNASVWQTQDLYRDRDADGIGAGSISTQCIGASIPTGFTIDGSDCNDENNQIWVSLNYASKDIDADGVLTNETGQVCSAGILPNGYFADSNNTGQVDCNDNDALAWWGVYMYTDNDNDGYGTGQPLLQCLGNEPHPGLSQFPDDCNDADSHNWKSLSFNRRDVDGDNKKVAAAGQLCTNGELPIGYFNDSLILVTPDCDDNNANIWRNVPTYPDGDDDGFGQGQSTMACIGNSPLAGFSELDTDCNDADSTVWALLQYVAVDSDSDNRKVSANGSLCTAGALPIGFFASMGSSEIPDCDDTNAQLWLTLSYKMRDEDSDGTRVISNGELCTAGFLPSGYFPQLVNQTIYDCNDMDATVFRQMNVYTDQDGDGVGTGPASSECIGTGLETNRSLKQHDCNDNEPAAWRKVTLYQDFDGDGIGSGQGTLTCMGNQTTAGFSIKGYDPLDDAAINGSENVTEHETPLPLFQLGTAK